MECGASDVRRVGDSDGQNCGNNEDLELIELWKVKET
jgi:hypothetical protein